MNTIDEKNLQQRIRDLIIQHRIMTIGIADDDGPWTIPVFYAQEGFDLIFVSNPNSRHGRAAENSPHWAATIYSPHSEWRKVQGLQMEGKVTPVEDGPKLTNARKRYTDKFPFTGVFFSQQEKLPEPLRAKVTDVRFYRYQPERIVLVDNTIHFGFHYEYVVNS